MLSSFPFSLSWGLFSFLLFLFFTLLFSLDLFPLLLFSSLPRPHFLVSSFLFISTSLFLVLFPQPSALSLCPPSCSSCLCPHLPLPPARPCVPALGDPLLIHHYFHGYLAGFSVRSGRLESREVIECLYACREGLDYRDFESLGKGMKVEPLPLALSFRACPRPPTPAHLSPTSWPCSQLSVSGAQVHVNPSQSLLTLEGDDVETFNHALQHVAYMNTLRFATPGVRPLRLTTAVK